MLSQLMNVITPDQLLIALQANPRVFIQAIQKFDTAKLMSDALSDSQRAVLTENATLINDFLQSEQGRTAIYLWADEFCTFVQTSKTPERAQIEARIRTEIEQKVRSELEEKIRKEMSASAVAAVEKQLLSPIK